MKKIYFSQAINLFALISIVFIPAFVSANPNNMLFWFDQPTTDWENKGLPIGNGTLGAVITGGVQKDIIQFNEKSLWEGGPGSIHGFDFGHPSEEEGYLKKLDSIQKEISEKGVLEPNYVAEKLGRDIKGYGNYQNFGDLKLSFTGQNTFKNYRRELDLERAVTTLSYTSDGVNYTREYFASYPDQVIVVRLSADQPASINMQIALTPSSGRSKQYKIDNGKLRVFGVQNENGLRYEAQLHAINSGGKIKQNKEGFRVVAANEVILLLTAGTDYAQSFPKYRGEHPNQRLSRQIEQASQKSFEQLINTHIKDHQNLFRRVSLDLKGEMPNKTIDTLLKEYTGANKQDKALEALYFQFGRYLLIASSRPGSLPANLQGVWNKSNTPPWNADYHVNINLQMNYWPAEVTNLSETNGPLFDFIDSLVEPGSIAAKKILGVQNGWTLFLNTNLYGFTGVIKWPTAFWQPEAGAWLAQHYYEHYLFTGDKTFLRERAYPAMKGAAQCWLEALLPDNRDGLLVVNPSYSPEHGGFTAGAAMSQQIVFDLLNNTQQAAEVLKDKAFAKQLTKTIKRLDKGTRIGEWGQLQEWKNDIDDPESKHRHISHLYALHPGRQISPSTTPELASAAKRSLEARGDTGTGWSKAWKINLWARLLNGDRAHKLLTEQLLHSTLPNMWDNHPPFQIDGNFGATAGIAEGSISGLKARGNIEVDIEWYKGKLLRSELKAGLGGRLTIKLPGNGKSQPIVLTNLSTGKRIKYRQKDQKISFKTIKNEKYELKIGRK